MHVLQPKHSKLSEKDAKELLKNYNISLNQLPKIKITDPALPEGIKINDLIRIERKTEPGEKTFYYRVVVA